MNEYPKIETLFNRDPNTFGVDTSSYRRPEFALIPDWIVTEKVDGTNIRIQLFPEINAVGIGTEPREVRFRGRTDKATLYPALLDALTATFPIDRLWEVFHGDDEVGEQYGVTLYGEGYGPKIQKGGGSYRDTPGFRLFDVRVGTKWLEWADVEDVAGKLGIRTVPTIALGVPLHTGEIVEFVRDGFMSLTADEDGGTGLHAEGIVARTSTTLYNWRGDRVLWKLKERDFR